MCLYPQLIKNKKYTKTKKNGGIIPPIIDERVLAVPIGCGKCMECRKQKARQWQVRLMEEIRENKNGHFVTLTFSNESIKELTAGMHKIKGYEKDNAIATLAVRRFTERWRKEFKKAPRHWLITELGHNGTENIHLHGFIWTNESAEKIKEKWKYGYIWDSTEKKGYVNEQTINYCVKYVYKQDDKHKEYNGIILSSKGIGNKYTKGRDSERNKYNEKDTKDEYMTRNGTKIALPIYYRNKIYSDEEREKLWLKRLDEHKRYVDGQEIDISKGLEQYFRVLKEARQKNKRLGYGDKRKDWDRKKYEEEQRELMHEKRTCALSQRDSSIYPKELEENKTEAEKKDIPSNKFEVKPNWNIKEAFYTIEELREQERQEMKINALKGK